jgi:hypothetical protein
MFSFTTHTIRTAPTDDDAALRWLAKRESQDPLTATHLRMRGVGLGAVERMPSASIRAALYRAGAAA